MGLYPITGGTICLEGNLVSRMSPGQRKAFSRKVQMIFQDPYDSLNPRQTVCQILEEKFIIHGETAHARKQGVMDLLSRVGLADDDLLKYPHEFSGGQRQRIGIARAVSMNPELIICDEPVSALDVSVQSKILNLLLDLQENLGLTYLFISHDLSVVRHMSDRIIVMYLGKIMEIADAHTLYESPAHPYTKALLAAIPQISPSHSQKSRSLKGEVPSAQNPPKGCRFNTRCPQVKAICLEKEPQLQGQVPGHLAACHFPDFASG